jgi:hypothetical protein
MRYLPPSQSIVCPLIKRLTRLIHFLTRPRLLLRLLHLHGGGVSSYAPARRTPDGLLAADSWLLRRARARYVAKLRHITFSFGRNKAVFAVWVVSIQKWAIRPQNGLFR